MCHGLYKRKTKSWCLWFLFCSCLLLSIHLQMESSGRTLFFNVTIFNLDNRYFYLKVASVLFDRKYCNHNI